MIAKKVVEKVKAREDIIKYEQEEEEVMQKTLKQNKIHQMELLK